ALPASRGSVTLWAIGQLSSRGDDEDGTLAAFSKSLRTTRAAVTSSAMSGSSGCGTGVPGTVVALPASRGSVTLWAIGQLSSRGDDED
ncbi:hypothetical protein ADK86_19245, partial [Streptomyces sp. NRRL F-5755]